MYLTFFLKLFFISKIVSLVIGCKFFIPIAKTSHVYVVLPEYYEKWIASIYIQGHAYEYCRLKNEYVSKNNSNHELDICQCLASLIHHSRK